MLSPASRCMRAASYPPPPNRFVLCLSHAEGLSARAIDLNRIVVNEDEGMALLKKKCVRCLMRPPLFLSDKLVCALASVAHQVHLDSHGPHYRPSALLHRASKPRGCAPQHCLPQVEAYFRALPQENVPAIGSPGEEWRRKQVRRLHAHARTGRPTPLGCTPAFWKSAPPLTWDRPAAAGPEPAARYRPAPLRSDDRERSPL